MHRTVWVSCGPASQRQDSTDQFVIQIRNHKTEIYTQLDLSTSRLFLIENNVCWKLKMIFIEKHWSCPARDMNKAVATVHVMDSDSSKRFLVFGFLAAAVRHNSPEVFAANRLRQSTISWPSPPLLPSRGARGRPRSRKGKSLSVEQYFYYKKPAGVIWDSDWISMLQT